jgi:hypothetical protein
VKQGAYQLELDSTLYSSVGLTLVSADADNGLMDVGEIIVKSDEGNDE